MYIKNIKLENYRNYSEFETEFDKNVNIIIGENAQGKTNLLESIYMSSFGKSFRTSKDREVIKFDEDFCSVKTEYIKYGELGKVEIFINKDGRKAVKSDGVNLKKISNLLDNILTVIFSPEDLKIIKEEPGKRRNFMDRELCQMKVSYLSNFSNYKKALLQRNTYLKENNPDKDIIKIWDEQLADFGASIIKERKKFTEKLGKISDEIHKKITNGKENLKVEYISDINTDGNKGEIKEKFLESLEKSFKNDIYNRNTSKGPHKDDLKIIINDIDARKYCSQGQQRTAALSLKLAEIFLIKEEKEESPVLLLDDVLSELDSERQKFLINCLDDVQIFITSTELSDEVRASLPAGKILKIEKGFLI